MIQWRFSSEGLSGLIWSLLGRSCPVAVCLSWQIHFCWQAEWQYSGVKKEKFHLGFLCSRHQDRTLFTCVSLHDRIPLRVWKIHESVIEVSELNLIKNGAACICHRLAFRVSAKSEEKIQFPRAFKDLFLTLTSKTYSFVFKTTPSSKGITWYLQRPVEYHISWTL